MNSEGRAFDVVVIGGGLAGCAAAILLAEAGHRVTLLEQHHYPRHKMCGEHLSAEATPILKQLGVWETIQAERPARLTTARIVEPRGRRLDVALPAPALGFSRYRLDHLLLERARAVGVAVYEGCAASEVRGSLADGFEVEARGESFRARVVLGAWGKRSTLDRTLERQFFAQRAGFMALKAHFRGPAPEERTELYTFPGGYCGINLVEGGVVNLCLLATDAAWARSGKRIEGMWAMIGRENPALGEQMRGAEKVSEDIVISNISFRRKAPVEQEVLMLGDSAELISPLAGNGQSMALSAAMLAAERADAFLRGQMDAATLCAGYAAAWRRQFRERLVLGRALQPLFLNPTALALGIRVANLAPPVAQWLVNGTRARRLDSLTPTG
ncbi:MAG TPA: FAD-dependent oxidoreductase [Ardenticatenaceae bacterium]|jgi:flavin-dependent dehydrogenase